MATLDQVRQSGEKFWRTWDKTEFLVLTLVLVSCFDFGAGDFCITKCDLGKCVCTNVSVECHDEKKLDSDIVNLLPCTEDHTRSFTITGSHFYDLSPNFLGSCQKDPSLVLNELRFLDLSNNSIRQIHGKSLHCMPHLETLILAHNDWMIDYHSDQTGYFTSLPDLKHLDLTNAFDEVWNGTIHIPKLASIFKNTDMTQLQTLKLAHNELFTFSVSAANSLCELTSLKTLDLSHNKFSIPALPTVPDCLEDLETLDVSYNKMPRLPPEFMTKSDTMAKLTNVFLGNNDYFCDCSLTNTYKWLVKNQAKVRDLDQVFCTDGYHSSYINRTVMSLRTEDLKCLQQDVQLDVQPDARPDVQPDAHLDVQLDVQLDMQADVQPDVELDVHSLSAVPMMIGIIFIVIGVTLVVVLFVYRASVCSHLKFKSILPSATPRSNSGYSQVQEIAHVLELICIHCVSNQSCVFLTRDSSICLCPQKIVMIILRVLLIEKREV